jgi:hypothetical protein
MDETVVHLCSILNYSRLILLGNLKTSTTSLTSFIISLDKGLDALLDFQALVIFSTQPGDTLLTTIGASVFVHALVWKGAAWLVNVRKKVTLVAQQRYNFGVA